MRMKNYCFLLICVFSFALTACSSGKNLSSADRNNSIDDSAGHYPSEGEGSVKPPTYNSGAGDTSDSTDISAIEKKVIKNAELRMESSDVAETYEKFIAFVKEQGGYEFSKNMEKGGDYTSITATVKVLPNTLDTVLNYANECGDVTLSNTSSKDITAEYYDIEIRLANLELSLGKYYEYLEEARSVDEMISLQNEINRLTGEIESFKGQLAFYNSRIDESEISLYIYQKNDPAKKIIKSDWSSMSAGEMGEAMLNGFISVCNGILVVLQWFIIFIFSVSPFLLIGGGITFAVIKIAKKRKK